MTCSCVVLKSGSHYFTTLEIDKVKYNIENKLPIKMFWYMVYGQWMIETFIFNEDSVDFLRTEADASVPPEF